MGNKNSPAQLHGDAKLAATKFDTDEMFVLRKTWEDMADRSGGKGIDKETFLQYFPLNGLLGDRLFAQFDTRNTGLIDFDDFVTGLAVVCRGTMDDKIHFLFNIYDVSHDKSISKQELAVLLNQLPKEVLMNGSMTLASSGGALVRSPSISGMSDHGTVDEGAQSDSSTSDLHNQDEFEEVDSFTNHDLVERAFAECDLNHQGRLTFEEFKMFVTRNPGVLEHIESLFPYNGPKDKKAHHNKSEALPHMRRISVKAKTLTRNNSVRGEAIDEVAGDIFNHNTNAGQRRASNASNRHLSRASSMSLESPSLQSASRDGIPPLSPAVRENRGVSTTDSAYDPDELCRQYLIQAMEVTQRVEVKDSINKLLATLPGGGVTTISRERLDSEVYHKVVRLEDYLWKKGKAFHLLSKRYYLLSGNCLYYYGGKDDIRPKGVVFITGCLVERIQDREMELSGYYGFELLHQDLCTGEHHRHEKRVLYCKTQEVREKWVSAIQHAAHVVPVEEEYVIGKELGRGRFSVVCECVNKLTDMHCAVKIIDKTTIEKEEKELLRTEIAVLKLVSHPNIIRMEGLYENKQYIYIVMEMLKGGELFERIVGRPRFTELECAKLLRPLLESVAYLHDLGIVHRDLKPENILCGENLEDLKIADFGLSKMVMPKEKMDAACGTLSYVAPEVLTMQGYGKEADLWSVGVIMFLLLCGKLPFDGDDHNEIIRSTIQADLKVNPAVWSKLSEEAKSLMTSLLNKSPKDRISARDALRHPFLAMHLPSRRASSVRNLASLQDSASRSRSPSSSPSPSPSPSQEDSGTRRTAHTSTKRSGASESGASSLGSNAADSAHHSYIPIE